MNRCLAFACALLFASLTVSSACFAQPIMRATRLVTYDDLDLSTPSGQKSLHRRLERALNQLCLDPSGPGPGGTVDPTCKSDGWQAVRRSHLQIGRLASRSPSSGNRCCPSTSGKNGRRDADADPRVRRRPTRLVSLSLRSSCFTIQEGDRP